MQPIFKQFSRSTSEFVRNKCVSEHEGGRMSAIEYHRAVKINSLLDKYAAKYEGKTVDIFRCLERRREYIEIQDLVVEQTQAWKILGPMHLTNPYDFTISVHRFMSGGAVNGARLGVIKRYCDENRDLEHSFVADSVFDEPLPITQANYTANFCEPQNKPDIAVEAWSSTAQAAQAAVNRSVSEMVGAISKSASGGSDKGPPNVTINAGNIVFPPNLPPIASSPIPYNPPKKRKIEILEELAEGMKSMTANFSRLLEEVKEENRGRDSGSSFDVIPDN